MYMLVPEEPNIGFVTLAVIFVSATLLGVCEPRAGRHRVFDAAMLVALWQFDKEDLLAGLLLFRLLYYIVPFALSLLILGGRELLLALARHAAAADPAAALAGADRRGVAAPAGARGEERRSLTPAPFKKIEPRRNGARGANE